MQELTPRAAAAFFFGLNAQKAPDLLKSEIGALEYPILPQPTRMGIYSHSSA
jgi:hypothetical protein